MTTMSSQKTLLAGGEVLVGDPLTATMRRADVLIEDGSITAIAADLPREDAQVIAATGRWIVPGFVDAHRHLWQTTMRGLTANWNLTDYYWNIRNHFAGLHDPDDVFAGQYAGGLDALAAGVTTTIDHSHITNSPEHSDAAVEGVKASGVRALWCYGFFPSPMADPIFTSPEDRFNDARRVRTAHFASEGGLVRMGVALTELGLLPFEVTREEIEIAAELDIAVTMHTRCIWSEPRVNDVEILSRAGLLRAGQIHSHANMCTQTDLALLRDTGCSVASTPDTELEMGCGLPIFRRAESAGVTAGIGADIVSNNSGDFFTAMRILMQAERGVALQPVLESSGLAGIGELPLTTRQILRAATLSGAEALGLGSTCGSVEVGKAADLLLLRNDRLHLRPVIDPVDSIVLQATTRDIDKVLVDGNLVVDNGSLPADVEHRGIDLIEQAHERIAERVARIGGWRLPVPPGLIESLGATIDGNLAAATR